MSFVDPRGASRRMLPAILRPDQGARRIREAAATTSRPTRSGSARACSRPNPRVFCGIAECGRRARSASRIWFYSYSTFPAATASSSRISSSLPEHRGDGHRQGVARSARPALRRRKGSAGSNGRCSTGTSRRSASTARSAPSRSDDWTGFRLTGDALARLGSPRHERRRSCSSSAVAENGVIGASGGLPWRVKADLRRFRAVTMGKPIVMGRKTFESIGRVLDGRDNIVVTRQPDFAPAGVIVAESLDEALAVARSGPRRAAATRSASSAAARSFAQTMPLAGRLHVTHVAAAPEGDVLFPGDRRRTEWVESFRASRCRRARATRRRPSTSSTSAAAKLAARGRIPAALHGYASAPL